MRILDMMRRIIGLPQRPPPEKTESQQKISVAAHALNNAASINQGKRMELRGTIDALSDLVNDMRGTDRREHRP